ncbi:MAG: hypothetical protein WCO63_01215 [Bacteroidota bacterium]
MGKVTSKKKTIVKLPESTIQLRPDEQDRILIERLKEHYNEKAATKAILKAANDAFYDIPRLQKQSDLLSSRLRACQTYIKRLQDAHMEETRYRKMREGLLEQNFDSSIALDNDDDDNNEDPPW